MPLGCAKLWLKIIIPHFVDKKWFSWNAFERIVKIFLYGGVDSNSRPPVHRGKKMRVKRNRHIIGTFAEVSTLIRSLPNFSLIIF